MSFEKIDYNKYCKFYDKIYKEILDIKENFAVVDFSKKRKDVKLHILMRSSLIVNLYHMNFVDRIMYNKSLWKNNNEIFGVPIIIVNDENLDEDYKIVASLSRRRKKRERKN